MTNLKKKITEIREQKKKKNRFNVFIDEKFAFSLSKESVVDSGIKTGDLLTQAQIDELVFLDQGNRAYNKALDLLDYRPRSEKEIKDKLKEKNFEGKIIEETIKKLLNLNLINDSEFAKMWVEDRKKLKPIGKKVLYLELIKKGIKKEIIEEFLEKITEEDELKTALNLVKGKRKFQSLPYEEAYKKVGSFLSRRGFPYQTVKEVIDKLYKKNY